MIIKKVYDEKTRTQKVWYDSSMLFYSEMVEDANENVGDLYITFKNGTCYKYAKVKFEDYVLLIAGGTDASQGKTLNKVIKGKYEYERLADSNMELLTEELNGLKKEENPQHIYFISGHRKLSEAEFELNYVPLINYILDTDGEATFVVGDYYGCDIMAQNYLMDKINLEPERITVYHMFEAPRNKNSKITQTKGGFTSDEERDAAMTKASIKDIAFVRNGKWDSGTAQNILRRYRLQEIL